MVDAVTVVGEHLFPNHVRRVWEQMFPYACKAENSTCGFAIHRAVNRAITLFQELGVVFGSLRAAPRGPIGANDTEGANMTYEPTARDIKRRVRIARAQIAAGGYKTRTYRSISRPLTEEDQTERVDVAARVGRILDAADANNLGVAKDAMRDFIAAYGLGRPFACRQCQNRYEWPGELDDHVLLSHGGAE